jgi:hypothetical protein
VRLPRLSLGMAVASMVPALAVAQPVSPTPPADFAMAAAACLDAVSPDKLDPATLTKRGWTQSGTDKAPFGEMLVFTRAGTQARIVTSTRPTGFCIVDAYGPSNDQFDAYRIAVGERLKADYGQTGQTDVTIGDPGSPARRQGFVIGNGVGGLSSAVRPSGFNLRFTAVNAQYAGSAKTFQTSRPPISDAEMAENRAADRAEFDYANQAGTLADLPSMVNACATALRTDSALPASDNWRKSTHGSGSPRAVAAIRNGDMKAAMGGMAHSSQQLYRVGKRGFVTKYFVRGAHNVCEAIVRLDQPADAAGRAQLMTALGLGKPQKPDAKMRDFTAEYMIDDLNDAYAMGTSTVALRAGNGTRFEKPNPATPTFSVFVF